MSETPKEVMRGTLDMLVLKTLKAEPMHGWGISGRIQELSADVLQVNQGALYPALHRLEKRGLIRSYWGRSENNRRAKYYHLTDSGQGYLASEELGWEHFTGAVNAILRDA